LNIKKPKKPKPETLIPLNDAIYTLGVAPQQFNVWRDIGSFKVINKNGKDYITLTDFKKLAYSENVHKSALVFFTFDIVRREKERLQKNDVFLLKNSKEIDEYRGYIKTLENIHATYHNRLDILHTESALVAAYILYYKVINLLYMTCLCLENLYWHSFTLLRPIDEAIDLAKYFIITEDTAEGRNNLKKWFRLNEIIPHSYCRKAESEYTDTIIKDGKKDVHEEHLRELYKKKSKMLHPTHHGIIEPYRAKIGNGRIMYQGVDYGPCSYHRKVVELTDFFVDFSIQPAVQGFYICFHKHMPLTEEDQKTLLSLIRKFQEEADRR